MRTYALLLILLLLVAGPVHVAALKMQSGDTVVVSEPVDDDLFLSGGSVFVNQTAGSVTAVGGDVRINAPVTGDVIAAGGTVTVNAPIGGKLLAAGGRIVLDSEVTNLVAAGGEVMLGSHALVRRDAAVGAGRLENAGTITGRLYTDSGKVEGPGSVGEIVQTREGESGGDTSRESSLSSILGFAITAGFLVLGLLVLVVLPRPLKTVTEEIRKRPGMSFLVGIGVLIGGCLVIVLCALSLVGIPLAFFFAIALVCGLLLASLPVSLALARVIAGKVHVTVSDYILFPAGFILLHLLFMVPWFIGFFVRVFVTLLALGAMAYVLHHFLTNAITAPDEVPPAA